MSNIDILFGVFLLIDIILSWIACIFILIDIILSWTGKRK